MKFKSYFEIEFDTNQIRDNNCCSITRVYKFLSFIASLVVWKHNWLGWISPPLVDEVLLTFLDFIVCESGQIVNDWMLANRCLNLHKLVLRWCKALLLLIFLHLFLSKLLSLLFVLVFSDALVSLRSRFGWTSKWTHVFFNYLGACFLN